MTGCTRTVRSSHTLALAIALAATGAAQDLDVAIVAAAAPSDTACGFTDPQQKLLATGMFASVGIINTFTATPTLDQLLAYDAAICWTNVTPLDNDAWGDVMADYVDAGGGVVVAVFANSSQSPDRHLGGRWETEGYEVIVSQGGNCSGPAFLGDVLEPSHPVMQGVQAFDGGSASWRPCTTDLTPGASVIAEWDDDLVLVASGASARRIDLGFYPPSAACGVGFWNETTDGALLMANALVHVGTAAPPGPMSYCFCEPGAPAPCANFDPDAGCVNSTGAGALMVWSGSTSVLADDAVVDQSQLPPNQFGVVYAGMNDPMFAFGDGIRCVGTNVIRYPIQNSGPAGQTTQANLASIAGYDAGDTAFFQGWYRDPSGPCGSGFNFTNAYEVLWTR